MSDLDKITYTDRVRYSKEHTWAKILGDTVIVGISDYAQDQLGEIVFIELPEVGSNYDIDEMFGFVESIKTASDLYIPVAGEVVEVNGNLEDSPEVINSDPFGEGWMLKVKVTDVSAIENLLDAEGYEKVCG